jgi:hypothetical protein
MEVAAVPGSRKIIAAESRRFRLEGIAHKSPREIIQSS